MLNALELNTYTILKIFISVTDFKKHTCVMLAICHDLALHSGFVYAHHVHFLHQSFMFQITCIGKTVFARLDAQSVQPVAAAIAPHRSQSCSPVPVPCMPTQRVTGTRSSTASHLRRYQSVSERNRH